MEQLSPLVAALPWYTILLFTGGGTRYDTFINSVGQFYLHLVRDGKSEISCDEVQSLLQSQTCTGL